MSQIILEIYNGISENIGIPEKEIQRLNRPPDELLKADFYFSRFFKGFLGHKLKPFKVNGMNVYKQNGDPLLEKDWQKLNKKIENYWEENSTLLTEEVTAKAFLLALITAESERQQKHIQDYGKKSLIQMIQERFKGRMPKSFHETWNRFNIDRTARKSMLQSYNDLAVHVQTTKNDVKDAIRQQIITAHKQDKTPIELASDMYWNVQQDTKLKDKHSAHSLMRDWHRIAVTELSNIHTAGKLIPMEKEAGRKPVYMTFMRGTCDWCQSHQGTIVRLIPKSQVKDENNDSLSSMGIKDEHTDIAVWVGKNNVGFKKANWRVCTPAHPYNVAILSFIDIEEQEFNPKTQSLDVKDKGGMKRFIPEEYLQERESWGAAEVQGNTASWKGNQYISVSPEDYSRKFQEWRQDRSRPIPVSTSQKDHKTIFGE